MHQEKNYTVQLHMHHFFQDHRAFCLAFINSSMNTINDFKNHISKIYKIQDFHLKKVANNFFYLPEVEDVRIIQPEDAIYVVPNGSVQQRSNEVEPKQAHYAENEQKKKKKRKLSEVTTEIVNNNSSDRKKKKNEFEPIAHSSIISKKRKPSNIQEDIVEKNVTFFEKLSNPSDNSGNLENAQEHEREEIVLETKLCDDNAQNCNKEEIKKKLESILQEVVEQDFTTPLTTTQSVSKSKKGKKNCKFTNVQPDDISMVQEEQSKNESKATVMSPKKVKQKSQLEKKQKLLKLCADEPVSLTGNSSSCSNKLIQHITPARCILPSGIINKKINIVNNIVTRYTDQQIIAHPASSFVVQPEKMECEQLSSVPQPILFQTQYSGIDLTEKESPVVQNVPKHASVVHSKIIEISNDKEVICLSVLEAMQDEENSTIPVLLETSEQSTLLLKGRNTTSQEFVDVTSLPEKNNDCSGIEPTALEKGNDNVSPPEPITEVIEEHAFETDVVTALPTAESVSSVSSVGSNNFVTRRKRIRKRTKKEPLEKCDSPMPSPITSTFSGRKLNVLAKPLIHLRFDNEPIPEESNHCEQKTECFGAGQTMNGGTNNAVVDNVDVDLINLVDTPHNHNNNYKPINRVLKQCMGSTNALSILGKSTTMEAIQNCRLLDKLELVTNEDVILFKKLKLGPDFNPEVSNNIVARIESIDMESQNIRLSILEGKTEFVQPQGMLSMYDPDSEGEPDAVQVLNWNELLQPRLLSP